MKNRHYRRVLFLSKHCGFPITGMFTTRMQKGILLVLRSAWHSCRSCVARHQAFSAKSTLHERGVLGKHCAFEEPSEGGHSCHLLLEEIVGRSTVVFVCNGNNSLLPLLVKVYCS